MIDNQSLNLARLEERESKMVNLNTAKKIIRNHPGLVSCQADDIPADWLERADQAGIDAYGRLYLTGDDKGGALYVALSTPEGVEIEWMGNVVE